MAENQSPTDDTRQRILQAAAEMIAEKGYARATTRGIAEAAGVNEVTLFRHFGSKRNLLSELIQTRSALPDLSSIIENQLSGDYHQDLTLFARRFLNALLQRQDALRLILCEANEVPEIRDVVAKIPKQLRENITEFLHQQIEKGVVRDLDPELMAQAFLGMFFSYVVAGEFLGGPASFDQSTEEIVTQFVDIFVKGTRKE
jgi:AcrR family transcriptional regulator